MVLPDELGVCVRISNPVELGILAVRTLNVTFTVADNISTM